MDRWTKVLLVTVAIPLWGLWLSRPAVSQENAAKVVTAQEFRLVNADGKVSAFLGQINGVPSLVLMGADSKPRAGLSLGESPMLFLADEGGIRLRAALNKSGDPEIGMHDPKGKRRISLMAAPESAMIELSALEGAVSSLFATKDAHMLMVGGNPMTPGATVVNGKNGQYLELHDKAGRARALIDADEDGDPHVTLMDKEGDILFEQP